MEDKTPQEKTEDHQIRWDGSRMRTTYANVCNVSSTREEVAFMFGVNKNWHPSQKELVIELSDRVIINPYAAKRLALLLTNTMAEYEKRFGVINLEMPDVTPQ
ncbi:DUF3467 domain-containing protein [Desulfomicrobium apsheronum]|nr:DUF3467 domain-containing protein [Desulfomicrobium apsheronum]